MDYLNKVSEKAAEVSSDITEKVEKGEQMLQSTKEYASSRRDKDLPVVPQKANVLVIKIAFLMKKDIEKKLGVLPFEIYRPSLFIETSGGRYLIRIEVGGNKLIDVTGTYIPPGVADVEPKWVESTSTEMKFSF